MASLLLKAFNPASIKSTLKRKVSSNTCFAMEIGNLSQTVSVSVGASEALINITEIMVVQNKEHWNHDYRVVSSLKMPFPLRRNL